ncbi:MAG: PAS domain S-box protein [Magnetococcales bacterium]|nr:PAS domain S-box protein [Magnetococcales bacterium]
MPDAHLQSMRERGSKEEATKQYVLVRRGADDAADEVTAMNANGYEPLRVLVIEDSEVDTELMVRELRRGGFLTDHLRVETAAALRQQLKERRWDIILSDYNLPGFDAAGALWILKETGIDIPFIVVSGILNTADAVGLMRAGAHDFIQKDDIARLLPVLERELREVEARRQHRIAEETVMRLGRILDESTNEIFVCRADTLAFFQVNRGALTNLGYTLAEMHSMTPVDLMPGWNRAMAMEKLAALRVIPGRKSLFEATHRRKDGTLYPVDVQWYLAATETPPVLVAIALDISERKQAEKRMRRLAAAVEQAADAILITAADGIIQYVNPSFVRIFGYTREVILEQNVSCLDAHSPRDGFFGQMLATLALGHVCKRRFPHRRRDGDVVEVEAIVSPLRETDGVVTHFVAVFRDMTREAQLEAQLRRAQKLEAIGTLAGGVAHDFNNILGAIIGYVELSFAETRQDDRVHGHLHEILQASLRARDLVAQLLAFSRCSEQERRPVSLAPILTETLKLIQATFPSTMDIRTHIDPDAGIVMANPTQIHQVVMNLCTNAVQAMQSGGGVLELTLQSRVVDNAASRVADLLPGSYVQVSVQDTGCGIQDAIRDRIFDPFFTTKRVGEGSGLGLSVAHGIIVGHGGSITVTSRPGQGARFEFYLPRIGSEVEKENMAVHVDLPRGCGRILFVDGEGAPVGVGMQYLEKLGYSMTAMTDPREAWMLFHDHPQEFDALVADQIMPHMSGIDLARKVLTLRPGFPVILCMDPGGSGNPEQLRSQGVRHCLQKPLLEWDLARILYQALHQP